MTCTFTNAKVVEPPPTASEIIAAIMAPLDGPGGDLVRLGLLATVGAVGVLLVLGLRARRRARVS